MRMAWIPGAQLGWVWVLACGPVVGVDGETGSASAETTTDNGTVSTTASMTMTTPSTSNGPSTVGSATTFEPDTGDLDTGCSIDCADFGVPSCPAVAGFECPGPIDCTTAMCGGPLSPFDELGCLRPSCNVGACAPDSVCVEFLAWGACASSNLSCSPGPRGTCECGGTDDCGGSYCIPVDEAPPALCNEIDDAGSCAEATCLPTEGRPLIQSGETCICELAIPICFWSADPPNAVGLPATYFRWLDGAVIVFPDTYDPAPLGWSRCGDPGSPPECACAELLPCAM